MTLEEVLSTGDTVQYKWKMCDLLDVLERCWTVGVTDGGGLRGMTDESVEGMMETGYWSQ